MLCCALQSGSNGNSIYVEAAGVRLLFDAGISARQARDRLASHGRRIQDVDALILSHDHIDHVSGAGTIHRLFRIPILATPTTFGAVRRIVGKTRDVRHFEAGETIEFGPLAVHTLPTPHDAVDGVAFVVEAEGRRLGIFTDLGHPFLALLSAMREVHAAYLESNYDPRMLADGPYHPDVKKRIRSGRGHLSNIESADLVRACGPRRPSWIALAHLSANNNTPEIALETHRLRVGRELPLYLARRECVSEMLEV